MNETHEAKTSVFGKQFASQDRHKPSELGRQLAPKSGLLGRFSSLTTLVCLASLFIPVTAETANARSSARSSDRWNVSHAQGKVIATDCTNCGEDTGIVFSCTPGAKLAKVIVNGAASTQGTNGEIAPVTFKMGSEKFSYDAKTLSFGEHGFIPVFVIMPNDPLVEWLQASKTASASFNGTLANISLKGSEKALEKFAKKCGWNDPILKTVPDFTASVGEYSDDYIPDYSQTVNQIISALPDGNGRFWHTGDGFGGGSPRELSFSAAGNVASYLNASCEGFGKEQITLKTFLDFGEKKDGDLAILEVNQDNGTTAYIGKVHATEGQPAHVSFQFSPKDPMWKSLAFSSTVRMRIRGGQAVQFAAMSGSSAFREFSEACASKVRSADNLGLESLFTPGFAIGLK